MGLRVIEIEPALHDLVLRSYYLSIYASEFRYPGDLVEPDLEAAQRGIEIAERIVSAVTSSLARIR